MDILNISTAQPTEFWRDSLNPQSNVGLTLAFERCYHFIGRSKYPGA
jgi:hypothetical protein